MKWWNGCRREIPLSNILKCHKSELKARQHLIRGEGLLQSNIYAEEDILFLHKDSVFRGGQDGMRRRDFRI